MPRTNQPVDRQPSKTAGVPPAPRTLAEVEADLPRLGVGLRILLFVLGLVLFLLGTGFGWLPGIPFIVLAPLGLALLSLASNRLNRRLRAFVLRRWPGAWKRIHGFRTWLHRKLT